MKHLLNIIMFFMSYHLYAAQEEGVNLQVVSKNQVSRSCGANESTVRINSISSYGQGAHQTSGTVRTLPVGALSLGSFGPTQEETKHEQH